MSKQNVDLRDVTLSGRILDIGGGGEGIISRHAGDSVIAIDIRKDELLESPDVGIKIVMDATDLKFLDNTFDNVTCFYSLMFMSEETVEKCLAEAFRVLKPNGCLWIWDTEIPWPAQSDVFVVHLDIALADEHISTGYGIGWGKGQSSESISIICDKIGFGHIEMDDDGKKFLLRAWKAASSKK